MSADAFAVTELDLGSSWNLGQPSTRSSIRGQSSIQSSTQDFPEVGQSSKSPPVMIRHVPDWYDAPRGAHRPAHRPAHRASPSAPVTAQRRLSGRLTSAQREQALSRAAAAIAMRVLGCLSDVDVRAGFQGSRALDSRALDSSSAVFESSALGMRRLPRFLMGKARQLRWRGQLRRRVAHRSTRSPSPWNGAPRRFLPLLALLGLSVACGLVSNDRGNDPKGDKSVTTPLPDLSKSKSVIERPATPWTYVLPVDHGVRVDRSGMGHFRAPRFHGEHNGLDLLAPTGTDAFSPCNGEAMRGASRSFGRWVHVICPIPDDYRDTSGPRPWASFFYAHLSSTETPHDKWVDVQRGQKIGEIGTSGNAATGHVKPHLHLELIIQQNHRHAMDERHLGKDQSDVPAAEVFAQALKKKCLDPFGFQPKSRQLRRARRIDPFVALTCLSPDKPDYVKAPEPLDTHGKLWTDYYVAENFNVNRGPGG